MGQIRGGTEYKIENLKGKDTYIKCDSHQEYKQVLQVFEKAGITWHSGHIATEKDYWIDSDRKIVWFEKDHITNGHSNTTIQASQFIVANGQSSGIEYSKGNMPKVGDWVMFKNDQLDQMGESTDWSKKGYGPHKVEAVDDTIVKRLSGCSTWLSYERFRPAIQEEVDGINPPVAGSDQWKVGDKLPEKWLNQEGVNTYDRCSGPLRKKAEFRGDRDVCEVRNGWAYISGTGEVWLKPKQNYPSYPGNKVKGKWKLGDVVMVSGTGEGEGNGIYTHGPVKCEIVDNATGGGHVVNSLERWKDYVSIKILEGSQKNCTFNTKIGAIISYTQPDEIPETNQVPVTESNARVGMKVVASPQCLKMYPATTTGIVGEIQKINGEYIDVMWTGEGSLTLSKSDLYIAPTEQTNIPVDDKWYVKYIISVGGDADKVIKGDEYEIKKENVVEWTLVGKKGEWNKCRFTEKYQKSNQSNQLLTNKPKTNNYGKEAEYISTAIRFRTNLRADIKAVTSGEGGKVHTAKCKVKPQIIEELNRKDTGCIGYSKRPKGQYIG